MAYTAKVIIAVVKNIPKAYFNENAWLYLSLNAWR